MKPSILCVDDEIPGLFLRKMLLEGDGYRVLTASSGKEALTFAESRELDAVILDFNMPEMDGGEVAHKLREEFPRLKIIMLSGYPENAPPAIRALVDGFVRKGEKPDELLLAIRTALKGKVQRRMEINPYVLFGNNPLIRDLLHACMEATAADFGNLQLLDTSRGHLTIVSQQGFGRDFLDYFQAVCGGTVACGEAMKQRSRVVVSDVALDPLFRDKQTRDVMFRAHVRSCQSTPLITSSGQFIGVVSTHFDRPREFSAKELRRVDTVISALVKKLRQ